MNFQSLLSALTLAAIFNLPIPASSASDASSVVDSCQAMRRKVEQWTSAEQATYRSRGCWYRVEADNGAKYLIDLGLIQDLGSGATTSIYNDEGGAFNVANMKRWYFTCTGHFSVMQDNMRTGPQTYAPPRSIAAQMSDIVCEGAHRKANSSNSNIDIKSSESPTATKDASTYYQSRYFLAGFLLRASNVCQGDKRDIEIAFSLLKPSELKAFSQNFPAKTEEWMTKGAENFNTGVMNNGIPETCAYALKVRQQADQLAKNTP